MPDKDEILLAVGELKGATTSVQKSLDRFSLVLDKHDSRISDVEKKQARNLGFAAGIGTIGGAILSTVAKKLGIN